MNKTQREKNQSKLEKYGRSRVIQRHKSAYHKAVDVSIEGRNMPL